MTIPDPNTQNDQSAQSADSASFMLSMQEMMRSMMKEQSDMLKATFRDEMDERMAGLKGKVGETSVGGSATQPPKDITPGIQPIDVDEEENVPPSNPTDNLHHRIDIKSLFGFP